MTLITPMLAQYRGVKQEHPDSILFFRMGDFYEMFYEDALVASKVLDIALTSRDKNKENSVPMCGVPWHAADFYIAKLIRAGHKVAICEQVEDPKQAKGIVERRVIRVITPGTFAETAQMNPKEHQYLCGIVLNGKEAGLAFVDLTTGDFRLTQFMVEPEHANLWEEIESYSPSEILYPFTYKPAGQPPELIASAVKTPLEDWVFEEDYARRVLREHFAVDSLDGYGCENRPLAVRAAGAALHYLFQTQKSELKHLNRLSYYERSDAMLLDQQTIRNLEVLQSLQGQDREGSLLGVIDLTVTAPGGRMLREWLLKPLLRVSEITSRQDAVQELVSNTIERGVLRESLEQVQDLERIASRITLDLVQPRHLYSLKCSAWALPKLAKTLAGFNSARLQEIAKQLDPLEDIADWIHSAVSDQPPLNARDGNVIKHGFDPELDDLRNLTRSGKTAIAAIEEQEKKRTGINTLKVGYNKVFGYYIEVSRGQVSRVPPEYERKQTLVNAERFVTPELKEYEVKVLTAEEKIAERELYLYGELCRRIANQVLRIQKTAALLAETDALSALAQAAAAYRYCRPQFHNGDSIRIVEGRHPCVELLNPSERFIPNDAYLDSDSDQI
ncbi:MAG TPA: DNA mismatch repair protein MutS, partial [Acidobacteriota bacterium]|nr:DNA mismatch repair protein MutS [Acidobacteriota bacterium]